MAVALHAGAANKGNNDDERVLKVLQEAGLGSGDDAMKLMDPESLKALREYLSESETAGTKTNSTISSNEATNNNNNNRNNNAPLSHVGGGDGGSSNSFRNNTNVSIGRASLRFQQMMSDLTAAGGGTGVAGAGGGRNSSFQSYDSTASTAGTPMPVEDRILKLLERQAQMILLLSDRIEELHDKVDEITTTGAPVVVKRSGGGGSSSGTATETTDDVDEIGGPLGLRRRRRTPEAPAEPQQQQPHAARPAANNNMNNMIVMPFLGSLIGAILGRLLAIPNRFYKLAKLFFELRRRQVPNFDAGLMIKVLVMMAILMARMSSSRGGGGGGMMGGSAQINKMRRAAANDDDDDEDSDYEIDIKQLLWKYRMVVLASGIIAGFLVHSGYAKFLNDFFFRQNYVARVLLYGQDIDAEQATREVAAREQLHAQAAQAVQRIHQAAALQQQHALAAQQPHPRNLPPGAVGDPAGGPPPAQQQPRWRQFLQGQVPRGAAAGQQQLNRIVGVFVESTVLVGSFFLSILPMWAPHAPPERPQEQQQQQLQPAAGADQPQQQQPPGDGPGQVRPPGDAAMYDDSDDEAE